MSKKRPIKYITDESGCYICTSHKATGKDGYPHVQRNGKTTTLRYYLYEQKHGGIPEGYWLKNKCKNNLCINLNHLKLIFTCDGINKRCPECNQIKLVSEFPLNSNKYNIGAQCRLCNNKYNKNYYQRKDVKNKQKKYYAEYNSRPENIKKKRESVKKYQKTERGKQKCKTWNKTKAGKFAIKCSKAKRKTKMRNCKNKITINEIKILFDKSKICTHCKKQLKFSEKTIDHIIPLANGGAHSLYNLQILCHSCNSKKSTLDNSLFNNGQISLLPLSEL